MIYTFENTIEAGNPVMVFVDGVEIKNAIYADTKLGLVVYYADPPELIFGCIKKRKLRGNVTVTPCA